MAACRPPHHSCSSESFRIEILAQQKVATLVGTRNGGGGEIRPPKTRPLVFQIRLPQVCECDACPSVCTSCTRECVLVRPATFFPRGSVSSFWFLFFFKGTHPFFLSHLTRVSPRRRLLPSSHPASLRTPPSLVSPSISSLRLYPLLHLCFEVTTRQTLIKRSSITALRISPRRFFFLRVRACMRERGIFVSN